MRRRRGAFQARAPLSLSRKNPGTSLCRISIFVVNPNPFLHFSLYNAHFPFFFPPISQPLEPQLQISQTLELIISSNLIYLPPQISRYFSTAYFRLDVLVRDRVGLCSWGKRSDGVGIVWRWIFMIGLLRSSKISMSTQTMRGHTARGYHRRKSMDLDLNSMPPTENRDQGETSQLRFQEAQVNQQQPVQPAMIDIEAIDDDVIESSARAFAEAKNKSRRNARKNIVDVDAEERSKVSNNNRSKRRRDVSNQQPVNSDLLINLEASNSSMKVKPSPPKEPKFSCPICMGPLVEETSTRCGHIFCKACIRAAIAVQSKCPTCRKRVTAKELIRVFLPGTSLE